MNGGKKTQDSNTLVCKLKPRLRVRGWRDGSNSKSAGCSSRGPEFNSQHPCGGSQSSIMRSGVLFWPAGIYADRILYT